MNVRTRIEETLHQVFAPVELEVIDESHLHAGHAGARPGGETHFAIRMVCKAFSGMSRIERQRHVFSALKYDMQHSIHALRFIGLHACGEMPDPYDGEPSP